MGISLGY